MSIVYSVLAGLATALGALGTLMFLVMAMAGGANSTPQQITMLKWFMLITAIVGLLCLVGGIVLIVKGHPGWASLAGAFPMIAFFAAAIWVSFK